MPHAILDKIGHMHYMKWTIIFFFFFYNLIVTMEVVGKLNILIINIESVN